MSFMSIRIQWTAGTGAAATATLYSHSPDYGTFRTFVLWDWLSRGPSAAATLLVTDDELSHFIFEPGSDAVVRWDDAAIPDDAAWVIQMVCLPL